MRCRTPCSECAFTEGAAANREPYNALKGQICLLAGIPFHCHKETDWRTPATHKPKSREQLREMQICAGWQREIRALARTGYFKRDRAVTKSLGELGLGALEIFVNGFKCRKAMAKRDLDLAIRELVRLRDCNEVNE